MEKQVRAAHYPGQCETAHFSTLLSPLPSTAAQFSMLLSFAQKALKKKRQKTKPGEKVEMFQRRES